jgi:molybdopterin synthase catalytic subunit
MAKHAGVHEKGTFNLQTLMASIKQREDCEKTGAVALFVGVARGEDNDGHKVKKLVLEAYEEKANEIFEKICTDLQRRTGIVDVQIHHLLGEFNVGEDLVYVAVAGSHRQEVFEVLREAVERYKHEAPVFKKEQIVDKTGKDTGAWVSEPNTAKNSP